MNENDLADFVNLQKINGDSENSWTVNIAELNSFNLDLSVKNPHKKDKIIMRSPERILEEMRALDNESAEILETLRGLL